MKPGRDIWLLILLLVTHLYLGNEFRAFANPNVHSRVYLTLAIVDYGTFAIDRCVERYGPVQDVATSGGHTFSDKPPGYSVLLTPIAWLLRHTVAADADARTMAIWLRVLGVSIPAALFWYFTRCYWIAQTGDRRLGLSVLLAGALGTNFFIYATQLFSHALAGILIFLAFRDAADRSTARAARCGLLLALAFTIDYIVAPAIVVISLFAILNRTNRRVRSGAVLIMAAGPIAALWAAYNQTCFDSFLKFSYLHHADAQYRPMIEQGWLGMHPPRLAGILGLTILPPNGLLVLSPFIALSPLGWWRMRSDTKQRGPAVACAITFLSMLLFAATLVDWRGGWAVSARYLAPTVPLLLVGVAAAVRPDSARATRWVFRASAALAIMQVTLVALTFPDCAPNFRNPPYDMAIPLIRAGCLNGTLWNSAASPLALLPFVMIMVATAAWMLIPAGWTSVAAAVLAIATQSLAGTRLDYGRELMLSDAMWRMGYYCKSDAARARLHAHTLAGDPNNAFELAQLTWLRATSPCDEVRDAKQAIELAERLVRLRDGNANDALAAAHASAGDFAAATAAINQAIAAATQIGDQPMVKEMVARRTAYQTGQAWRRPVVGR